MSATDAAPTPTATARRRMTGRQPLPLGGAHRLGVADAVDPVAVGRHDHRGGDDGPARRRHADLVHAGHARRAAAPQRALPAEGRDDHGHRRIAYPAPLAARRAAEEARAWHTRRHAARVRPGRRVHHRARPREPARRRARRLGAGHDARCAGSPAGPTSPRRPSCLPPDDPGADYRVRIFTPDDELPFAGHPTLGSVPRVAGGGRRPARPGPGDRRQCGAGLVDIRRAGDELAFAAPPLAAVRDRSTRRPRGDRRFAGDRPRGPSSTRRGATTGPAGSSSC